MVSENKRKTSRILSLVIMILSLIVILGRLLDINKLKSICLPWEPMDFSTAIAFILSGIILYFISKSVEGEFDKAQIILFITSLVIVLFTGIYFFSACFDIHNGFEAFLSTKMLNTSTRASPEMLSLPVLLNFFLVSTAGVLTLINPKKLKTKLRIIGLVIAGIGALAIFGYLLDLPSLYYYKEGINSVITCCTAVLFVLLGLGFLCL